MNAVGYRQVADALARGAFDEGAVLDEVVRATRSSRGGSARG